MDNLLLPIFTLLGVVVGSAIQYVSASRDRKARGKELDEQLAEQRSLTEKQIFASVRSSNRQAWINALRSEVATYLNLSQQMALLRKAGVRAEPGNELEKMKIEAGRVFSAIQLRLNPDEDMHIELLDWISELNSAVQRSQSSPELFDKVRASTIEQAQKIFKFEWNRVKRGE